MTTTCHRHFAWLPTRVSTGRVIWLRHCYRVQVTGRPAYYTLFPPYGLAVSA